MKKRGVPKLERRELSLRVLEKMTGLPNESPLAVALWLNVILTPRLENVLPFPPSQSYPSLSSHLRWFKFSVDGDFHLSLAHARLEFTEITVDLTRVVAFPSLILLSNSRGRFFLYPVIDQLISE